MKDRSWACLPFTPLRSREKENHPYICHIAPYDGKFEMQWLDKGSNGAHTLYYRLRDSEESYTAFPLTSDYVTVEGLQNDVDYEIFVARDDGSAKSNVRLVSTTPLFDPEASVVNYVHPEDQQYNYAGWWVGIATMIRLPSGKLLAGHEIFGQEDPCTILFESCDEGKTWRCINEMVPFSRPRFFMNKGKLYITSDAIGVGGAAIAESLDEGKTWSEPVNLIRGMHNKSIYHNVDTPLLVSTPPLIHNGRIYIPFEVGNWTPWDDTAYDVRMLSASCDSDLLDRNSWEFTPGCIFDHSGFDFPDADFLTAIEGNPVVGPDGEIYNLVRFDAVYGHKKKGVRKDPIDLMLLYKLKSMDEPMEYLGTVSAKVGNRHTFCILKDDVTGLYFMMHNEEGPHNIGRRSMLSLSVSKDLINWAKVTTLFDVTDVSRKSTVSQPYFIFDGDDILYLSRTAWGNTKSEHDNNMATLHRIKNFRNLVK